MTGEFVEYPILSHELEDIETGSIVARDPATYEEIKQHKINDFSLLKKEQSHKNPILLLKKIIPVFSPQNLFENLRCNLPPFPILIS